LGLQRKGNKWRFPEEIAIEDAQTQQREAEAAAGKRIEQALREILQDNKRSADALATLRNLNDPLAVPRIAKMIAENRQEGGNPAVRRELVDLLGRIGNAPSIRVLCETALRDEQRPIRDRAVEIIRNSEQTWAPEFFIEYLSNRNPKSDNPLEIDRAAEALGSLPDPRAIRPLIEALVTIHKQVSTVGAGSSAGFNNDGGIGFGQGSKEVEMTFQKEHPQVLSTLLMYSEGANYQYDEDAWRQWYADTRARTNLSLRRDP
ncbi:MAG: HEAT repeat domain-containing protein, partial [Pirellulaceae bacterium]